MPLRERGKLPECWKIVTRFALGTLFLCAAASGALSQPASEFYKGRTVELYIGYSVGGGYDVYARLLARHLGRHLPGPPGIVPTQMAGGGRLRLAKWLAKAAPRDGAVFGTIGRGIAFDP